MASEFVTLYEEFNRIRSDLTPSELRKKVVELNKWVDIHIPALKSDLPARLVEANKLINKYNRWIKSKMKYYGNKELNFAIPYLIDPEILVERFGPSGQLLENMVPDATTNIHVAKETEKAAQTICNDLRVLATKLEDDTKATYVSGMAEAAKAVKDTTQTVISYYKGIIYFAARIKIDDTYWGIDTAAWISVTAAQCLLDATRSMAKYYNTCLQCNTDGHGFTATLNKLELANDSCITATIAITIYYDALTRPLQPSSFFNTFKFLNSRVTSFLFEWSTNTYAGPASSFKTSRITFTAYTKSTV